MEETNTEEVKVTKKEDAGQKQIAAAILVAGILIAGAVLLKDSTPSVKNSKALTTPISKTVGLNVKSFNTCLASGKYKDKVQADIDDASGAKVSGTPSSLILKDGIAVDTISGAQPFEKVLAQLKEVADGKKGNIGLEFRPISASDHILGNPNARIIILEYSDLECPFCKVFHATMHRVIKENADIAWVYRHYPIAQLHSKAFREAEATECAWEQGGNETFWKYTDKLFEVTPSNNGLEDSML